MIEVKNVMMHTTDLADSGIHTRERCDFIMRKYLIVLGVLMITFFIAACSQSKKEAATEEHLEELNVHMLAKHEDKELDEYYSELYENLKHTIKENPNMGKEDKFTVQSYRMFENYQGPFYVFIGINRNQEAIENVSFDLSLFNKEDHLIWDDKAIFLTDEEVGTIPGDTVFPILVPINKNTMEEIKKVDFKDLNMSISDLQYETAGL